MSLQGFKTIPLLLSSERTKSHELFIKEHSRKDNDDKPRGQTLFVLNVPPLTTEASLANAFAAAGKINKVILEESGDEQDGFKRAYIVFSKQEYLKSALKLVSLKPLSSQDKPLKIGLSKWIEEYNQSICIPDKLLKKTDNFLNQYEHVEKKQNSDRKEEITDDEGWTLVTKGGRKPSISRTKGIEAKLKDKATKASKRKELKNFYTFQIRESQMKNIATLRKNFEEAKKKVNLMKQSRRFKPY
nr:unnamed protein product [Callosobruchus chinensis]